MGVKKGEKLNLFSSCTLYEQRGQMKAKRKLSTVQIIGSKFHSNFKDL